MKSLHEYMDKAATATEASIIGRPDEIDAKNPEVKKILTACRKNSYQLKKAFCNLNSKGKPNGWFTISVTGDGAGYHPEVRFNMNGKPGSMFYLHVDLQMDMVGAQGKAYALGLTQGAAMVEALNKIDGSKLPGLLFQ